MLFNPPCPVASVNPTQLSAHRKAVTYPHAQRPQQTCLFWNRTATLLLTHSYLSVSVSEDKPLRQRLRGITLLVSSQLRF